MKLRLSLRSKLAVAFLSVLAPILFLEIHDYQDDYQVQQESVLKGRLGTAQAVAALVDSTFDEARGVSLTLASDPMVRSLDPTLLAPYLVRYRSTFPQYESINVWDASGQGIAASTSQEPGAVGTSVADREHFQRAMATGRPAVSEVIQARTTNRPSVAVITPVRDDSNRIVGAVSILLDLTVLPQGFRRIPLGSNEVIVVADQTGRLAINTSRPELSWEERDASRYQPIERTLSIGSFAAIDRGILDRNSQVVAMARSPEYGWAAGVLVPEEVALGPVRDRAAQQVAMDLVILLVAGVVGLVLMRTISVPLGELARAIGAFGAGDLQQRADVRTGDELEVVAGTFNRMASSLQEEHERLRFLLDAGVELTSSLQADRILALLTERSVRLLGDFAWACVTAIGGEGCGASRYHSGNPAISARLGPLFEDSSNALVRDLMEVVALRGESALVVETDASGLTKASEQLLQAEGVASLLGVPLRGRSRNLGVLVIACMGKDCRLGEEQLALAGDLAARAAISIDNALLLQQVQDERRQLDAVIERMGEGVTVADGEGRILHLNRRGREMLGLQPIGDEPVGLVEHLAQVDLRYPDGRPVPMDQRPISRAIRGEVFSGEEGVVVRPDGMASYLLFSSGVVRDAERVRLAMTIYMDITPIKELERAREEFISVVAHDLRSPITTIMGYAGILRQLPPELHGGPREDKALESILSGSRRLERMVADLLDASRIEARRLLLSKEPLDLVVFLREVVGRASELINGRVLRLDVGSALPAVDADATRLEQIMDNLISNAGKYSYADSEIVVAAEARGDHVLVSVTNRGEGIAPEETEAVFSRFHRTGAARASRAPGLGLGLYITKGLVEAHGGKIWVEDEASDYTIFRFTLPVSPEPPTVKPDPDRG